VTTTRKTARTAKQRNTRTTPYDVAAYMGSAEDIAAYLNAWLTEAPDDAAGITRALGDVARAKGMTQVAKEAGLSRESLYRALGPEGNPSFATVIKVARALGVRLHVAAAKAPTDTSGSPDTPKAPRHLRFAPCEHWHLRRCSPSSRWAAPPLQPPGWHRPAQHRRSSPMVAGSMPVVATSTARRGSAIAIRGGGVGVLVSRRGAASRPSPTSPPKFERALVRVLNLQARTPQCKSL
jgi:probable addiction module antidote protein